jgi:hypothetical protein
MLGVLDSYALFSEDQHRDSFNATKLVNSGD